MKDFHFYIYEVVSVLAQPIHLLKALIVIMFLFFPALLKDVILFHTLPKISLGAKFFVHHTVFKFTRNKQRKIAKAHTVHFQT